METGLSLPSPLVAGPARVPKRHSALCPGRHSLPSLLPPSPTPVPYAQGTGILLTSASLHLGASGQEHPARCSWLSPMLFRSTVVLSGNLPGGHSGKSIFGWDAEPRRGLWEGAGSSVGLVWAWRSGGWQRAAAALRRHAQRDPG